MLIVRLSTGLGNQMYEYMAGYALAKELKQELVLDLEECVRSSYGYLLDNFNIPASRKIMYPRDDIGSEEYEFYDRTLDILEDFVIIVRTYEQKERYKENDRVVVYSGWDMLDDLKKYNNLYMYGHFFQQEKYFAKYWNELRMMFTLKDENDLVKNFRKLIYNKISVGIHIRRGDMLLMDWSYKVEDDYYRAAIECCRRLYNNCIFCVFSDDIDYAKKILGTDDSIYYIHFYGYDDASVNEFYCLSLCDHRVLTTQSTFGQLADALNSSKDGNVFIRELNERKNSKSLVQRSANRMIPLNRDDIQKYCNEYSFGNGKKTLPIESDAIAEYKRFLELVDNNRNHEALQLAFCIYHEKKDNVEFKLCLVELLTRIGAYEEGIVELAWLSLDIVESYFRNLILDVEKKKELWQLYQAISNVNEKCFIIVMGKIVTPAYETYGLVDLAIILSHLNHAVTIIYETDKDGEYYLKNSRFLHNARNINLGCYHVDKKDVLNSGIVDFYNGCAAEELIVVSEDSMFFERENCDKKLRFVAIDSVDFREEICQFKSVANKVDFVLTQDSGLVKQNEKYIYWEDKGYMGRFQFLDVTWKYGYGQRLNGRMIHMAEALLKFCCK